LKSASTQKYAELSNLKKESKKETLMTKKEMNRNINQLNSSKGKNYHSVKVLRISDFKKGQCQKKYDAN